MCMMFFSCQFYFQGVIKRFYLAVFLGKTASNKAISYACQFKHKDFNIAWVDFVIRGVLFIPISSLHHLWKVDLINIKFCVGRVLGEGGWICLCHATIFFSLLKSSFFDSLMKWGIYSSCQLLMILSRPNFIRNAYLLPAMIWQFHV